MSDGVIPQSLKDAPALIERLLPVQRLSAEAYKEQMAVHGKTLTALGSYWKGRKPLILNKACILGSLLPATSDASRDLEVFEMLMGMDDASLVIRQKRRPTPKEVIPVTDRTSTASLSTIEAGSGLAALPTRGSSQPGFDEVSVAPRPPVSALERSNVEAQAASAASYRQRIDDAWRPEEIGANLQNHVWDAVNAHLGTDARSIPDLVDQLGIMRFGHRPRIADTFCGSGQIPFEAARLGCDVRASDLNPVACMLTWGAFNIIGGSEESRADLAAEQQSVLTAVRTEIDQLGIESDGCGWQAKVFLYCAEARCPQSGWLVPLLPTLVVSKGYRVTARLLPDPVAKRYDVALIADADDQELLAAQVGTVRSGGRGQDPFMAHTVNGVELRTRISTLRGDHRTSSGVTANRLRMWDRSDFKPRDEDIFGERLYCVQWMRTKSQGRGHEYEFRGVTAEDVARERVVDAFVAEHLNDWQSEGWVPDMRIEPGYNTDQPIRERGWTYWHHLFNPRQLLIGGLMNRHSSARLKFGLTQVLNANSRLSRWNQSGGGGGIVAGVFDNQALNTLLNYGCRASAYALDLADSSFKTFPIKQELAIHLDCLPADQCEAMSDIYVTDPPYGDAVNYDEILEFFIGWLRKNPPAEFAGWTWDSRRSLAIKGADEGFRRSMVAAYKRMTEFMPHNGIQVIMFTHQSGSIWADMANIVWASGLHVTAAWYVATEAERRIQEASSYVKGTVLLVCRKRSGTHKTTRDDLAWEIQEEVEAQVGALTGLNEAARGSPGEENVFEDADIQMAGYAAALRVLTRYATIDGRDMVEEAIRPRVRGGITFVDGLISFAVNTANQSLVPSGLAKVYWDKLSGAERFYLKMLALEARGVNTLDNYQNFAKAFKVRDFRALMADERANRARLKGAVEFGRGEMGETSQFYQSILRAVLYALMELVADTDGAEVMAHLTLNVQDYYGDVTQRELALEIAAYIASVAVELREDEARAARVLAELIKNHRLG